MPHASTSRLRTITTAATCLAAALLAAAPAATAAPTSALGAKSVQLQWATADPAPWPIRNGTLTVGGVYTCTEPAGTSVLVTFSSLQLMPVAMPAGSGSLPCGPGVIDAPWQLTSFPTADVHHGYTSVFLTFGGQGVPPQQLTA